jgi:hypothetical protein
MPRGKPASGFRKTAAWYQRTGQAPIPTLYMAPTNGQVQMPIPVQPIVETKETDEQIDARIAERFEILADLTDAAISGQDHALIISGPAGLGKSFTVEQKLEEWDPEAKNYVIIKGFVRPTGLYKLLFDYKDEGKVIVFDDADSLFFDDTCLNFLKAVCENHDKRTVSYLSETKMVSEVTGEVVPRSFEFNGTIIFISNYDFDSMIQKSHKLGPHLQAMMSRSQYLDLSMKTRRDCVIRIIQVLHTGLFDELGLSENQQDEIIQFIFDNLEALREISIRTALKIASIRKTARDGKDWKRIAKITCCKQ